MADRFKIYPVGANARPRRMYEYLVTGRGMFPYDMLRYDCCWPARGEDAALLDTSVSDRETRMLLRTIMMRSHCEPTIDRWSSFGWSVGLEKL